MKPRNFSASKSVSSLALFLSVMANAALLSGCGSKQDATDAQQALSGGSESAAIAGSEGLTTAALSANLLKDPGFETSVSGFYKQTSTDTLSRITTGTISGAGSLSATLKAWGNNIWWDYVPPSTLAKAQAYTVSAKVKGVTVNAKSNFMVCAVAQYVNSSSPISQCNPASQTAGTVVTVTSSVTLDPTKTLSLISVQLSLDGSKPVTYVVDDVTAVLTVAGTAPAPSPSPSPTVTATATPAPSPSPTVTATATPVPSPTATATATPSPSPTATATATPTPTPTLTGTPVAVSGVWANEGGDKVAREELRLAKSGSGVVNSTWNGSKVQVFGAKNEVVSFNVVLEAATTAASGVSVSFNQLTGPGGFTISSAPASGDALFNWTSRDIELFYVRYLQIKGLSILGYNTYDERHIPARFRRPWTADGAGSGTWANRPDHDKSYPDIAVPLELVPTFSIAAAQNQSIWADVYVPKNAPSGLYTGSLKVLENGVVSYTVPVELTVKNFSLPDAPSAKTMLYVGYPDIAKRYVGSEWPSLQTQINQVKTIRDRHFQMAHRHKISLIDSNSGDGATTDTPATEWLSRLNGTLFSSGNGYRGPGEGVGNGIFSVGTYGSWEWQTAGQSGMNTHTNAWANWFSLNSPLTDYFLYLIDESDNYPQIQQWANWIKTNPGSGRNVSSMATMNAPEAVANVPDLNTVVSTMDVGDTTSWQNAVNQLQSTPGKRFWMYNGRRPASGSFMTDDDGVALRELAWGQYKKGIGRWFYWESTYYNDYQSGRGQTNVFQNAETFGGSPTTDSVLGQTGWNYANGDGVLFYPGTDKVFPAVSYNVNGPIASLRLKHWRRGIQDVDYLTLAAAINPAAVQQIVQSMVPKILWENGVTDPSDPTWVKCDISWSSNPDVWEAARIKLANIIETGNP